MTIDRILAAIDEEIARLNNVRALISSSAGAAKLKPATEGRKRVSYWPSHDRIYIAPVDAQADIISQWQHWYSMHGENFDYKPMKNNPPEDWAW